MDAEPQVCLSVESTVALAHWANEIRLVRESLEGCDLIEWRREGVTFGGTFDAWIRAEVREIGRG